MSGKKQNPASSKSESKSIDFKSVFDPDQASDWCELLKDFVAIANSGGGTIIIGVADTGQNTGNAAALKVLQTDPATITDKVAKYTGVQFDSFTIDRVKRSAPEYHLIDPDKTHPWRQKELLQELNKSLPTKVNSYDLLAVRRLHGIDGDPNFVHKPRFGSAQYSPSFAKWLLEQHSTDPTFFQKCRPTVKPVGTVHAKK